MTEPHIERFGPDVSIESLIEALDQDGVAMVADAIGPEQLSALNAEFDGLIAGTDPGTPNHIPMLIDFMGHKTVRIDGLPGKSKSFVELLQHPLALEMADHYLLPSCLHYLLSTAQLIEIQADETVQHLHRDDTAWIHPPIPTDRDAVPTVGRTAARGHRSLRPLRLHRRERRDPGRPGEPSLAGEPQAPGARGGGGGDEGGLGDLLRRQDPPRRGSEPDAGPAAAGAVPRLLPRVAPHQGELLHQHTDRGGPRHAAASAAAARLRDPRWHRRRRRRLPERAARRT